MANYGHLILISSDSTEQLFPLTGSEITLGRDESNDIVLIDQKASRLHARLKCSDQGCVLTDAGSANGTFVEGQLIEQITLHAGNLIKLGTSILRFETTLPAQSAPPQIDRTKRARPGAGSADRRLLVQFLDELAQEPKKTDSLNPEPSVRDQLLRVPRLVIHTPVKTWDHRLQKQTSWTIGRDDDNDIVIDHQKVSRHHAQVEQKGNGFIIRDLGSANGTYLGQQRIDQHPLRHADTLNIGYAQLVFKGANQIDQGLATFTKKTERVPVIVIPGSFGSALWQGSEKIWPNVRTLLTHPEKFEFSPNNPLKARGIMGEVVVVPKVIQIEAYSRIGDYLQDTLGYTRGQDLLEFAYDWRDDVRLAAQHLAETVNQWAPTTPPIIIAHSLGCSVSRYYVDCLGGDRQIKKLILMGGANYGGPFVTLSLLPDSLEYLPAFITALGGALGKKLMRVFASFPVNYQMLPTYPAIFDQYGQPLNPYEDSSWLPPDKQDLLQAGYEFQQSLNRKATVPTTCIFGYGSQTITRLDIERDEQGRWQHVEMVRTAEGDGNVPAQSAILEDAEIHPVHQSHNQLYVDEDVLIHLKYELTG